MWRKSMLTSRARNIVKKVMWSISRYQASPYDLRNSSVLRLRLKDANDEDDVTVGCSMLEQLPQGMHDRRVSSAESEAQQDWPSKPAEGSVVTQSPTRAWICRRGSPAPVHGGICRPAPPACSRSDLDIGASADHGGAVSRARFYGKRRSAAQTHWAQTAICPSTDPWCRRVWHCRSQGDTKPMTQPATQILAS